MTHFVIAASVAKNDLAIVFITMCEYVDTCLCFMTEYEITRPCLCECPIPELTHSIQCQGGSNEQDLTVKVTDGQRDFQLRKGAY